ncbi:MAG: tRNA guanosine(34) transglycosylase Tgt, partial [Candidatus Omnitrophica bacterium 4484_171]
MFNIIKESENTKARLGCFITSFGAVETPAFFPVATQAALKGLSPKELDEIGISGLLVNAYHLYLRPGVSVIEQAGGLHNFMGFYGPIITDSGG